MLEELTDTERCGLIEPLTSEWSAPIVVIGRRMGRYGCVSTTGLNNVTSVDAYPMPRIDKLTVKDLARLPLRRRCTLVQETSTVVA